MNCSPPSSSVDGISQARILEWVAISFSRGSSQPRDWTRVSRIDEQIIYHWATREAQIKVNCNQFQLLAHSSHSSPSSSHWTDHCACVPGVTYSQLAEARVGKKGPVFQILGICALIADCCFWSQRCRQRGKHPLLLHIPSLLQVPPLPAEVTSRAFKGSTTIASPFIFFFFSFSPIGSRY